MKNIPNGHRPWLQPSISPAMKLIAMMALAVVLQSTPGLLLAVLLSVWMCVSHRARFLKLLRRVRLLVLVLFGVTLFMTPGTALFPAWGLYPTVEGLSLALNQLLRLVGMLAAVTWLLDTTEDQALAAGSLALLQPLVGQREWPERAVARLLLVFHYLEAAPKPRNLHDILALAGMGDGLSGGQPLAATAAGGSSPDLDVPTQMTLDSAVLTTRDIGFGVIAFTGAVLCLVMGVQG